MQCRSAEEEERTWAAVRELLHDEGGGDAVLAARMHRAYVLRALEVGLPRAYTALDASRPWLIFWALRSLLWLDVFEGKPNSGTVALSEALRSRVIATLEACWSPTGGYGGGPGQVPHTACTYAALAALRLLGMRELEAHKRDALASFLRSLAAPAPGGTGLAVHVDGEVDVRGTYCGVAAAALAGVSDSVLGGGLGAQVAAFVLAAQSAMDGGFGAVPGAEAHAGYTYCGAACLSLLVRTGCVNVDAPVRARLISAARFARGLQCGRSGGMRGRTNKVVDACYSFWAASVPLIVERVLHCADVQPRGRPHDPPTVPHVDHSMLAAFVLRCCQNSATGGLRDKPGKTEDLYHTCYALSGLALCRGGALPPSYDPALNV